MASQSVSTKDRGPRKQSKKNARATWDTKAVSQQVESRTAPTPHFRASSLDVKGVVVKYASKRNLLYELLPFFLFLWKRKEHTRSSQNLGIVYDRYLVLYNPSLSVQPNINVLGKPLIQTRGTRTWKFLRTIIDKPIANYPRGWTSRIATLCWPRLAFLLLDSGYKRTNVFEEDWAEKNWRQLPKTHLHIPRIVKIYHPRTKWKWLIK